MNLPTLLLLTSTMFTSSSAFQVLPHSHSNSLAFSTSFTFTSTTQRTTKTATTLFESKIPKELRAEIYQAEAKTPAAQGRQNRILGYGASAFVFLVLGLANVIFTSMKTTGMDLEEVGYGWSQNFLLTGSTIGGYIDIIMAGLLGTMVELENKTKEETAERIYEELERRKQEMQRKRQNREKKRLGAQTSYSTSKGGKKSSAKKAKRLAALAEVIVEDSPESQSKSKSKSVAVETNSAATTTSTEEVSKEPETKTEEEGGIMGKLKNFYKQADTLAASQALLLNKKLEEEGLVDKITDETGLKVIGKEAAAKATEGKKKSEEKKE